MNKFSDALNVVLVAVIAGFGFSVGMAAFEMVCSLLWGFL